MYGTTVRLVLKLTDISIVYAGQHRVVLHAASTRRHIARMVSEIVANCAKWLFVCSLMLERWVKIYPFQFLIQFK
jgi:hypothetical protein